MATAVEGYHGSIADFNIQHGFTEALVRGMRSSFLPDSDYHHLTQCESLEDVKLNLTESDYGTVVADISSLTPSNLQSAAVQKVRCLCSTQLFDYRQHLFLNNVFLIVCPNNSLFPSFNTSVVRPFNHSPRFLISFRMSI
jgi:hypothetical protein